MDWESKTDVTMDFTEDARGEDKVAAILTQLIEVGNLISNHLGSHIDPSAKPTSGKAKTPEQVNVTRMAMKPLTEAQEKKVGSLYKNRQMPTRDYTGLIISKEEIEDVVNDDMNEYLRRHPDERERDKLNSNNEDEEKVLIALTRFADDEEKFNPAFMVASALTDEKKAMANPLSTSEGKALLTALNEAANKLRKFLSTARIDGGQAQMPQDLRKSYLRQDNQYGPYYIQMNYKRNYPYNEVQGALSTLRMTEEQAKMNSQSAEHLEYYLNIDNPNYPIPRDRMVKILNKKYNLNLTHDSDMDDGKVRRPSQNFV